MKTIKTFLPVFPGFYGTHFEANEEQEMEQINELRSETQLPALKFEDFEFDYKTYEKETGRHAVDFIEEKLNELLETNFTITFEEVISPREYNFYNDSFNIEIKGAKKDFDKIYEYINNNFEPFKKYILDRYSSRSGFSSFYTNDASEFIKLNINKDTHVLGALLEFIFENEKIDSLEMYYYTSERVYLSAANYEDLIKV